MGSALDVILERDSEWFPYHGQELLQKDLVHVFIINVSEHFQKIVATAVLSVEELAKAERFLHQQSRHNYIAGKYFLRLLLSRFLYIPPVEINFQLKAKKKPAVAGIEFNVSHSKDHIVIAFSQTAIGIDIEHLDQDFQYNDVMDLCFSKQEAQFVKESPQQLLSFYTLWTRKEALLKATGEGLVDQLDQVPALTGQIFRQDSLFHINSLLTTTGQLISVASTGNHQGLKLWTLN